MLIPTRFSRLFTALTAVGIVVAELTPAHANEQLTAAWRYHAAACHETETGTGTIDRSDYRITNTGGSPRTVICPFTPVMGYIYVGGDTIPVTGNTVAVSIQVNDSHSSANITCQLMSRDPFGSLHESLTASTGGTPGAMDLSLDGIFPDRWNYSFFVKCTLPSNGADGFTKFHGFLVIQKNVW